MVEKLSVGYILSDEVAQACKKGTAIVALESTVITHGLPKPENLYLGRGMEAEVRTGGATPATVAVLDGEVHIGLTPNELDRLASLENLRKVSRRDLGIVQARKECGGTTIAATMIAAHAAGINVLATGGIGGVHRDAPFDISADLPEMGRTPMMVVCAGAKAILDINATVEYFETTGVPILGYKTDAFPAFYSLNSGLPVNLRVDSPEEAAAIAKAHWGQGLTSGLLVVVPPPEDHAVPSELIEEAVKKALREANEKGIRGQAMTPFLLARVSALTGGASLQANLSLLYNNARIATSIARVLANSS
jgi:pseudouridine-5'-phosphate glycosidase